MTNWTVPRFRCKCGGWTGWNLARDFHDPTCPFPLDIDADESSEEYQTWRAKFVPEKEYQPVRVENIEEYEDWYVRVFTGGM